MSHPMTLEPSTILIAGLMFTGPFPSREVMPDGPGILSVLDIRAGGVCKPVDVRLVHRCDAPTRYFYWRDVAKGRLAYAYLDSSRWSSALVSRMMHHLRSVVPTDRWHKHWSYFLARSTEVSRSRTKLSEEKRHSALVGAREGLAQLEDCRD